MAPFIDLGALGAPAGQTHHIAAGFDIRLDLPGGIVLTIARCCCSSPEQQVRVFLYAQLVDMRRSPLSPPSGGVN
jgi:hypothetical protein